MRARRPVGHAFLMTNRPVPWSRSRGFERLLAQETNLSDLIQFLSDRDPQPWSDLVGFVPDEVAREAGRANHADLFLTAANRKAVVEVKLGHLMSADQQKKYETLPSEPDLYLAALSSDESRLEADRSRWAFLSLSDLVGRWRQSPIEAARVVAAESADVLEAWDELIRAAFERSDSAESQPVSRLNQKFLTRVVTRRIAQDLGRRGRIADAGVTSGGGLPLVQSWTPIRGEGIDRAFIAEVRWRETKPVGELRFGVDFDPRPGHVEDEEVRRAAYDLACSMDVYIDFAALRTHLSSEHPELLDLVGRKERSRPKPKGDWQQVVVHGFKGAPLEDGSTNSRRRTTPGFYGDGALRFQAIADVDFDRASANDLTSLIDTTLTFLSSRQP